MAKKQKPRKYDHIKFEEVSFGNVDDVLLEKFLEQEMSDNSIGDDPHEWGEYGLPCTNEIRLRDDSDDDNLRIWFEDRMGQEIPSVPSTILHICGQDDVYIWVVPDKDLLKFRHELSMNFSKFVKDSGSEVLKEEITTAIKRGFKHGVSRGDIVKIMNEIITAEVMES